MSENDTKLTEAYELGLHRGWDHGNFVDAYGKEHERRGPDFPSWMGIDPNEDGISYEERRSRIYEREARIAQRDEFKRGWTDGRRRFARGQWQDGTKIED
jgi:hypothetical protein